MSVADRKGYLRRWVLLKRKGHTPKKTSFTVAESIDRGKTVARRHAYGSEVQRRT